MNKYIEMTWRELIEGLEGWDGTEWRRVYCVDESNAIVWLEIDERRRKHFDLAKIHLRYAKPEPVETPAYHQTGEAAYCSGMDQLNRILVGLVRQYGTDGKLSLNMETSRGVKRGEQVRWCCTGRTEDDIVIRETDRQPESKPEPETQDDLPSRLRSCAELFDSAWATATNRDAAAEIERLRAELVELLVKAFCEMAYFQATGDSRGWWVSNARTDVKIIGDKLVHLGLWERHPAGRGRWQWYRPIEKDPAEASDPG